MYKRLSQLHVSAWINMLPQTTDNNACISITPVCTHAPNFVNEISYPWF